MEEHEGAYFSSLKVFLYRDDDQPEALHDVGGWAVEWSRPGGFRPKLQVHEFGRVGHWGREMRTGR